MHRCCAHHERTSACTPNLYVYTLPEVYRDVDDTSPGRGIGAELLSPAETRNLLPGFPAGLRIWDSQQTAIGDLYYERALGFRCRTHSPASADLFFVPA